MAPKVTLLDQLRRKPFDARFAELRAVLEEEGFILDRVAGSHYVFRKEGVIFVVPVHNKRVKSVYVKRAIAIIDDMRSKKD